MSNSSFFRSEEMTLCQLFLQSESAFDCVSELGEIGLVQFRDLNPDLNSFQRKFVNEVRRCDDMERKLRYLEKEIKKEGIQMVDSDEYSNTPQPREMADMETAFHKLETELREVNHNSETLKRNFMELTELKYILRKTQLFFDEEEMTFVTNVGGAPGIPKDVEQVGLLSDDRLAGTSASNKLGFMAGVILRERLPGFERMLWRVCRGNVFWRLAEIETPLEEPTTGDPVLKTVFIIFFQGDQLKTRVKKICEGFRATVYPCPESPSERREMSFGVMTRLEDLNTILSQTNDHRQQVLMAAAKSIKTWFIKVRKIKAVYHTLNLFSLDVTQKCLIGECWISVSDLGRVQFGLTTGAERAGSTVPPILHRMETAPNSENPPTYNKLNKFTRGFQTLVDAFGIATYREVNPAPYTIITFPFLFAVMFGDAGHASIMILFAAWMVLSEKKYEGKKGDEIWNIIFSGRYILLLMGLFSFYTGMIYNDVFSKSLNFFGSSWSAYDNMTHDGKRLSDDPDARMLDPLYCYSGKPYPIGFDPVWQVAENKITFLNAAKMKISIIIGVMHMLFGICLSLWNHVHFKRQIDIVCEFIPRILFMLCLFMYLCVLMFHKWIWYGPDGGSDSGPNCAPSILITFINMMLFSGIEKQPIQCNYDEMFAGQGFIQQILLFTALLSIPWMLLAKPFVIWRRRRNNYEWSEGRSGETASLIQENASYQEETSSIAHSEGSISSAQSHSQNQGHGHGHDENAAFSDIMILQGIHTIEYVLSSVSHTASYLRLWALSLAHAQLSDVLWTMVLRMGLSQEGWFGGIVLYFMFAAWAFLTVGILVCIEGMSAFLHTLRLHWVEFQSKFYAGEGYIFTPFSFKEMLNAAEDE